MYDTLLSQVGNYTEELSHMTKRDLSDFKSTRCPVNTNIYRFTTPANLAIIHAPYHPRTSLALGYKHRLRQDPSRAR